MSITQKSFDFSVRIAELVRYLRENGKEFPLANQLLECGVGIGLACRQLSDSNKPPDDAASRAASLLREADYLLEMAVRSGYLSQRQSIYVREDAQVLLDQVIDQIGEE